MQEQKKGELNLKTGTEVMKMVWDGTKNEPLSTRVSIVVLTGVALTFSKACEVTGIKTR